MTSVLQHRSRLSAAWLAAAAWAVPGVAAQAAQDGNSPADYAIRIPVTLAAEAPLQRVVLPAEVLVRLQSPGYADLRLFNGAGQPVPMALAGVTADRAPEESVALPAYPILGAAGSPGIEGLSLRIEERQGQRVVQIDTPGTPSRVDAGTAQAAVRGALIDARAVQRPVTRMALDADLPAGQPVTFTVQASTDLKTWRPLAETVLYRADAAPQPAAPGRLGTEQIDLQRTSLKDHYLRVTWGDAAVTLRGATLATAPAQAPRERVSASLAAPALGKSPRELVFALPFATPLAALQITPQGNGPVLVPVRVLGRNHREQPWRPLASAVVYKMPMAGREQSSAPVELGGVSVRELKIEADPKTPGFSAAPQMALQFEPAQLVFLASGPGPFTLAAGLPAGAAAAPAFLPLPSLVPGYQNGQEATLPRAQADVARAAITGGAAAGGPVVAAATSDGFSTRSAVLWGVLLAGVVALAAMAWLLVRQTRQGGQAPADGRAGQGPGQPSDAS